MKNKMRNIFFSIAIATLLFAGVSYAQVGSVNFFKKIGDSVVLIKDNWELGSAVNRISKIWADDADITNIAISGAVDGDMDMEDNNILFNDGYISFDKLKTTATTTWDDVLENGDFESQNVTNKYVPDDWILEDVTSGDDEMPDYDAFSSSTDAYAGSYAIKHIAGIDVGGGTYVSNFLFQELSATDGQTMQMKTYAKTETGSPQICAIYSYDEDVTEDEYSYNWTGASAGTFTLVSGFPSSDQMKCLSSTGSYTELDFTEITLPATGVDIGYIYFWIGSANQNDAMLIDNTQLIYNGSDTALNGDWESWTLENILSQTAPFPSWVYSAGDESIVSVTTTAQSGSYAAEIETGGDSSSSTTAFLQQEYSGTATTEMIASLYSKCKDNYYDETTSWYPSLVFTNASSSHTEVWDFALESWVATTTPVKRLVAYGNAEYEQLVYELSTSTNWSFASTTVEIPTSGDIVMHLVTPNKTYGVENGGTYSFDDVQLLERNDVGSNTISIFKAVNGSTLSSLEEKDSIMQFLVGGEDAFRLDGLGRIHTAFSALNFTGEKLQVAEPIDDNNPATKNYTDDEIDALELSNIQKVAVVEDIDTTATGDHTIYTVPTGYKFIMSQVFIESSITGGGSTSEASLGTNSTTYDDMVSNQTMPNTDGTMLQSVVKYGAPVVTAGTDIKLKVNVAGSSTTHDVNVYLFGLLVPTS